MNLNKSTRFALYALIELAKEAPGKLSVMEIAGRFGVSEHHLSKVMQTLARFELVAAARGVAGGYQLIRDPKSISVMEIIRILEPGFIREECQLKSIDGSCNRESAACAIRDLFHEVSQQVSATFSAVTIDFLARKESASQKAEHLSL